MKDDGGERKVNVGGERCRNKQQNENKRKVAEERVNDSDRRCRRR